jgi:hypothetical protein
MTLRTFKTLLLTSTLCSTFGCLAHAADAVPTPAPAQSGLSQAVTGGQFYWEERYRYETVNQGGFANDANANTLRSILGYKTGVFADFQADVAVLNVSQFGEHDYNDGSDGKTGYPMVRDPGSTELFHGSLAYTGLPQTTIIGGRQDISLDNERWVGTDNWRQIAQTFDGITAENKSLKDFDFFYGYLFDRNGSGGPTVTNGVYDMSTNLFHIAYSGLKDVKLIGYSYLADIDNNVAVPGGIHGLSTATTGGRVEAKIPVGGGWAVTGNGEYARQVNYDNNPNSFGLNYFLIEPGAAYKQLAGKVGYEVLGSNGTNAVQAPMMSPHPMNGWADQFTVTPVNGLVDSYADVSYRFQLPCKWLNESKIEGMVHSFGADQIDQHYGNEYDLDFTQKIADHYAVGAQYADYEADQLLTNTRKIILTLQLDY